MCSRCPLQPSCSQDCPSCTRETVLQMYSPASFSQMSANSNPWRQVSVWDFTIKFTLWECLDSLSCPLPAKQRVLPGRFVMNLVTNSVWQFACGALVKLFPASTVIRKATAVGKCNCKSTDGLDSRRSALEAPACYERSSFLQTSSWSGLVGNMLKIYLERQFNYSK